MKVKDTNKRINHYKEKFKVCFNQYFEPQKKNLVLPLVFILIFYGIALFLRIKTGNNFYLLNFIYIGTALGTGLFLTTSLKRNYSGWGRRIPQLLIGTYMLLFIGVWMKENIQIEGFFFYIFSGIFTGSVLHYIIAKVAGPVVFNRGWCGWACWTAMVLDILPWKNPEKGRVRTLEKFRYASFLISLILVIIVWFALGPERLSILDNHVLYWLITGNLTYYVLGIFLAFFLKDNRAFCKYFCPVSVIMKLTSHFSLLKVAIHKRKCTECGLCEKNCPMNIKLMEYKKQGTRILSTECILCCTCVDICPEKAIHMTFKYDRGFKEYLNYSESKVIEKYNGENK